ncbi:MAG: RNA polymerase sigma factor [Spirochaetes bacterium]|jgi:RNA polymerase sigma-70 factor (ECF subfamily)|nr:RNA polymerase sigma factor [Spirochaetota bacterium]
MLNKEDFFNEALKYKMALLKIANLKMGNSFDAEDALEEAMLRAYDNRSKLRSEDLFYPWLKRIVINYCNDLYRNNERAERLIPQNSRESEDPEKKFVKNSAREEILDMMLTIEPDEYAEVLILYFYRKFSYESIAIETGVSVGTVKSRLSRAKELLARNMRENGITFEEASLIGSLSKWPDTVT